MNAEFHRFPWAEATTREAFRERLDRVGGRLSITLKNGEEVWAVKYRSGVVYLEGGGKVRLSRLVWTPLGYQEIESEETDPHKRAIEAMAQMDRRIAIADLDRPRAPLAMLSKRLAEEKAAQEKAGTTEFQTLDILTEKVISSWLRSLADADEHDPSTCHELANLIEAGEHRRHA
jgi:hypothetical protein